jgi:hypothetical protein
VASAPFLMHLRQAPLETANRYAQTAVLDPTNQVRLPYLSAPEPLPRLLALQVERTLGMFDRHPDGGGLLPSGRPVFPRPIAALALVSVVYGTVRGLYDLRVALMAIWFWVGLSGVLLTVETPNVLRAVGIMPPLFVLMAVLLVDVVDRVLAAAERLRPSGARVLYAGLVPGLLALAIAGSEAWTYFDTFRELQDPWGPATREGQLIARLGADGPVYSLEMNEHMVTSGWVRLLAPGAQRGRLPNPGRDLLQLAPVPEVGRQGVSFVFSRDPNQEPYFDLVQRLYPGGSFGAGGDGRLVYGVPADALAAARGPLAQSAADPSRWTGGVQLRGGVQELRVRGPGALRVSISEVEVGSGERDVNVEIAAAHGVHFVEVASNVAGAVELQVDAEVVTDTYRLMDAPWGLRGRLNSAPTAEGVLDGTVAMAFFDPSLGGLAVPTSLTWSGWLHVPRSGTYRMAFAAEDPMRLDVDGARVDVVRVGPGEWAQVGVGSLVELTEGSHSVRVTLDVTHGGRNLARWNWVPPNSSGAADLGGEWAVVPPMLLRPESPVRKL